MRIKSQPAIATGVAVTIALVVASLGLSAVSASAVVSSTPTAASSQTAGVLNFSVFVDGALHTAILEPSNVSGSVTIPDTVSSSSSPTVVYTVRYIDVSALSGLSGLTSVTIPAHVVSIRDSAFQNDLLLNTVTMGSLVPGSSVTSSLVTEIHQYAFANEPALTSVVFAPASALTTIHIGAFSSDPALASIVLPSTVSSIRDTAFSGDTALTSAIFSGPAPVTVTANGQGTISSFPSATTLHYLTTPTSASLGFTSPLWQGYTTRPNASLLSAQTASITISPAATAVAAVSGKSVTFTAQGYDASGKSLGDVTADTTFTSNSGTWSNNTLTFTTGGNAATKVSDKITATDNNALIAPTSASETVSVAGGSLAKLVVSPSASALLAESAGNSVTFKAEGYDAYGNDLGDYTSQTTFTNTVNTVITTVQGTTSGASILFKYAGTNVVKAVDGAVSTTVSVSVAAGGLAKLVVSPTASALLSVPAGTTVSFKAEGFDGSGNDLGDYTSFTTFTNTAGTPAEVTTPGASILFKYAGTNVVKAVDGAVSTTVSVSVAAGGLAKLVVSPTASALLSVPSGSLVTFTARGADAYGNDLGDYTSQTTFTNTVNTVITTVQGTTSGASILFKYAGTNVVKAVDGAVSTTVSVSVAAGVLAALVVSPSIAPIATSVTAGDSATFLAEGYDAAGNDLGNYTNLTTFTNTVDTVVAAAGLSINGDPLVTFTKAGTNVVRGTVGKVSASVTMTVSAGLLATLVMSPSVALVLVSGSSITFTTQGFDAFGNALGSATAGTTFASDSGTWVGNVLTLTTGEGTVDKVSAKYSAGLAESVFAVPLSITVTNGALAKLVVSPSVAPLATSVTAGDSVTFSAEGYDAAGNDLGDVTSSTAFTNTVATVVTPAGVNINGKSMVTFAIAGPNVVRGTVGAVSASVTMTVAAGVLAKLVVSPSAVLVTAPATAGATVKSGDSVAFSARGFDAAGNDLGDLTKSATFTDTVTTSAGAVVTAPGVTISHSVVTFAVSGANVVSAQTGSIIGSLPVAVSNGLLAKLVISPATSVATPVTSGGSVTLTTEGFDAAGNDLGDVTADTVFGSSSGGWASNVLTFTTGGALTDVVSAKYSKGLTAAVSAVSASFTVSNGVLAKLVVSPSSFSAPAQPSGSSVTFSAEGFDAAGNDLGDVTADTAFASDSGTWLGSALTFTTGGGKVDAVSAKYSKGLTSSVSAVAVSVTVSNGVLAKLVLSHPELSSLAEPSGCSATFTAEGYDAAGNDLGDVTKSTTFTNTVGTVVTPAQETDAGAMVAFATAGPNVVTAVDGAVSVTLPVAVIAGVLAKLVLSPSSSPAVASATAFVETSGSSVKFTADGFDAAGNDLGDVSADTIFSSTSGVWSTNVLTFSTGGGRTNTVSAKYFTGPTASVSAVAVDVVVINGGLAKVVVSPSAALTALAVTSGDSVTFTAEGFDAAGNDLGDVTRSTTFTNKVGTVVASARVTDAGAVVAFAIAGPNVVTAVDGAVSVTVPVSVAHSKLAKLDVSPSIASVTTSVAAGDSMMFSAQGFDAAGNNLGDYTNLTTFTNAVGPVVTAASVSINGEPLVTFTAAGPNVVSATVGTVTGSVTMAVTAGVLSKLVVSPSALPALSVVSGSSDTFTAKGLDAFGNDLGDYTGVTTFTNTVGTVITPAQIANGRVVIAFATAGANTVKAVDGAVSTTVSVNVAAGVLAKIVVSPPVAPVATSVTSGDSLTSGESVTFSAEGFDAAGNDLGGVTSVATFASGIVNSAGLVVDETAATTTGNGNSFRYLTAGLHSVTARVGSISSTPVAFMVVAGALATIAITPVTTTIVAGGTITFATEGFDAYGNSRGDATPGTTFALDSNAAATSSSVTFTAAEQATVTATDGIVAASTTLKVTEAPLATLSIAPATSIITSDDAIAFTTTGADRFSNALGDQTAATTFTSTDPAVSIHGDVITFTMGGVHSVTATEGTVSNTSTFDVKYTDVQLATNLNRADKFSVLAGAAITIPGGHIVGDIGAQAALTVTDTRVSGNLHDSSDVATMAALTDLASAYARLKALPAVELGSADLGEKTLLPGVYHSVAALTMTGQLTLDAKGDPNAIFVIQSDAALNTTASTLMLLKNGAKSSNIFWVTTGAATLGASSTFEGVIISNAAVTVGASSVMNGRAFSVTAAVTLGAGSAVIADLGSIVAAGSVAASVGEAAIQAVSIEVTQP